jgi:hypothetical protein
MQFALLALVASNDPLPGYSISPELAAMNAAAEGEGVASADEKLGWGLASAEKRAEKAQANKRVNELEDASGRTTGSKLEKYEYPLRFYLSDAHDEMRWGKTPCDKIDSVLTRLVPLSKPMNNTATFVGCMDPKFNILNPNESPPVEHPLYQHARRDADEKKERTGQVVLWKSERGDGCGSNSMFHLLAWALANHNGWVYGGELPLDHIHPFNHSHVFFGSDCKCMSSFTGIPQTLHNRLKMVPQINNPYCPSCKFSAKLKDPFPIVTG